MERRNRRKAEYQHRRLSRTRVRQSKDQSVFHESLGVLEELLSLLNTAAINANGFGIFSRKCFRWRKNRALVELY